MKKWKIFRISIYSFIWLLTLFTWVAPNTNAKTPMQISNGKIVFTSNVDGDREIYSVNEDGSDFEQLTDNDAEDSQPVWSPGGSKIAFVSSRDDPAEYDVFVMNVDGSNPINLTSGEGGRNPIWSADSTQIAFERGSGNGVGSDIWLMDANGSNQEKIYGDGTQRNIPASWSPDGSQIAFLRSTGDPKPLYETFFALARMNPDGSERTSLNYGDVDIGKPDWSPDGQSIVFEVYGAIARMDIASSEIEWLNRENNNESPRWSPDGQKIVFVHDRHIYTMSADSSNLALVYETGDENWSEAPDWQPIFVPVP